MKKIILIIFIAFIFLSCDNSGGGGADEGGSSDSEYSTVAYVRFQNSFTDGTYLLYGIGLGSAKYSGSLYPGNVTSYYSTQEGTYSVQLKTADGSWMTDSLGAFTVYGGHGYTVTVRGTMASYSYLIVQDY